MVDILSKRKILLSLLMVYILKSVPKILLSLLFQKKGQKILEILKFGKKMVSTTPLLVLKKTV